MTQRAEEKPILDDDASGQVTRETTKLTKNKDVVKNYTYDSVGNKSAFAVKVGDDTKLSLNYSYDGALKLTAVTDETGNEIAGYTYDTDGNLAERTVAGNGMTTTYTYDYQNRLTAMKNQTVSAGVISEYNSEYLANGQKSEETSDVMDKDGRKSQKTATYTYDLLGRIKRETKTGSEDISYTYDSNNNRKQIKIGNKITAYKYNKNDELLRTDTLNTNTEEDKVVIYKNDKNGNQLATVNRYEIPSDRKNNTYVDIDVTLGDNRLNENVVNHYNALNQLTQTLTKNYKVSFTYDAGGLRTSKTVNGETTIFVWDGDQLVMELTKSGKVKKRYIRGNDLIFADKGTDNASGEASGKQYYVTDPHGNVVQLTDETGNVIKTYEYDSFGNEIKPDSKDDNPFRYCGEYYDKETEEIYLRARYYQPEMGRFLTRDTYTGEEDEPLSLHLYTYCENDGVNSVDPSGHKAIKSNLKKYKKYIDKRGKGETYEYMAKLIRKNKIRKSTNRFNNELKKFRNAYKKNKEVYKSVSSKAKVPAQLVAAIHYRENTTDCLKGKFNIYLHNGDKLGKPTVHEPKGIYYKKGQFVSAAINAIENKARYRDYFYKLQSDSKNIVAMCSFALVYNGKPSESKRWKHHPYIFSGTNLYKKGKYISDGRYSSSAIDKQVGIMLLIDKIYNIQ